MLVSLITRVGFQALDGEGARLNGGRWNAEGTAIVYTSATLALAALEYLVHVDPEDVPADLVAMRIEIPDNLPMEQIRASDLPSGWNQVPGHPACVERGEAWVATGSAILLRTPSAIVPEEANILINPGHPSAARITVVSTRPFAFDPRLLA